MINDELKTKITNLELPEELESILVDMIDSVEVVNSALLNTIADILDNQSEYYEKLADALEQVEVVNELTNAELQALDEEEYAERLEAYANSQQETIKNLGQLINNTAQAPNPSDSPQSLPNAPVIEKNSDTQSTQSDIAQEAQFNPPTTSTPNESTIISNANNVPSMETVNSTVTDNPPSQEIASAEEPKPTFVPSTPQIPTDTTTLDN